MRAFEQGVIGATELWRAFDKTVEGGRWWLRQTRAYGRPQFNGYGNSIFWSAVY